MLAHGSTLKIGGVLVGELTSIGLPDRSRDDVESTHHGSGGDREFIPGLRDGGSISVEGRLATGTAGDLGQDALEANYAADGDDAIEEFIITLPDSPGGGGSAGTTYTFDGFVTSLGGDLPFDDVAGFSAEIKISGPVVRAKAHA